MKKILLSCVTCLLAVGLLAGCDDEVEEVTPEDPNAGVVEPSGDDSDKNTGPEVVKTGKLGFLQANKGAYYYFTGELNGSGFGVCSTDFSEGADVTVSKEEDSYYLSIEVEKETLYLSCPDTEHSAMELSKDPYALVYNAEFDTFTTVDDTKFIGTYGTYETLCWANLYYNGASNLGAADEFCASVFTEAQSLPAPTTLTVTGSNEVYVGNSITLTATVNDGADKSVTWSWEPAESSEGEVTVEGGKVTGVTAGEVVVTATSTVAPSVSDSITITVLDVPEGLPFELNKPYWFGYEYSSKTYYFAGEIYSQYYGQVTTTEGAGTEVIVTEVEGGYALGFVDASGAQKYISLSVASQVNFGIADSPFTWQYDHSMETFVADSSNTSYYIGNYYNTTTTYNELRAMKVSEYGSTSTNTYCVAKLIEPPVPTSLTISGSSTVEVSRSTLLTATDEEGRSTPVTWSSSSESVATVSDAGLVTGVAIGDATITATSTRDTLVSATFTITVTEFVEKAEVTIGTYDFTTKTAEYDTSTGVGTNAYSDVSKLKATFDAYWTSEDEYTNPLSAITETSGIYNYASSGNASWTNDHGLLKTGSSSANGVIKMTLTDTITKVEINQTSWTSGENCTITINTVSHQSTTAGTNETLTFEIAESTDLDMTFAKRCAIYTITLYGYVD